MREAGTTGSGPAGSGRPACSLEQATCIDVGSYCGANTRAQTCLPGSAPCDRILTRKRKILAWTSPMTGASVRSTGLQRLPEQRLKPQFRSPSTRASAGHRFGTYQYSTLQSSTKVCRIRFNVAHRGWVTLVTLVFVCVARAPRRGARHGKYTSRHAGAGHE